MINLGRSTIASCFLFEAENIVTTSKDHHDSGVCMKLEQARLRTTYIYLVLDILAWQWGMWQHLAKKSLLPTIK